MLSAFISESGIHRTLQGQSYLRKILYDRKSFLPLSPIHSFVLERKKKIRIGIVWSDNGESLGSVVKDEAFQGTPGAQCREVSMQTLGSTVHHCRMRVVVRTMKQPCASFSRAITSYSAYLNKKSRLLYNEHGKKPGACRAVGCNCAFQPWTFLWCHSVL